MKKQIIYSILDDLSWERRIMGTDLEATERVLGFLDGIEKARRIVLKNSGADKISKFGRLKARLRKNK